VAETVTVTLPYRWTPRPYQQKLWKYLEGGGTRAVACWPRRHGKDEVGLHHMACATQERIGNYWYMLPQSSQARKSMWDAINSHTGLKRMEESFPLSIRANTNEQEMKIDLTNGSTVQLVGSDNYRSLLGAPPVGLVFSEWKEADANAWGYLRPILLENGGWAYFNSTPLGKNHFYTLCQMAEKEPTWFYEKLTNDDTQLFTQEQMEQELREMQAEHGDDYGRALWLQEYYTSFEAAIPGAIWGDALEKARIAGRITDFEHDRMVKVTTGWDLGRVDDTSIWFGQPNGQTFDIIDNYSGNFLDICNENDPKKSLVHILLERRKTLGITYGTHWLPHDARPRTLAAGGKSILQQFKDACITYPELGIFRIAPRLDRQEGIVAGRKTIHLSRFHKTRCAKGLEHLKSYHREYDQEKKMFVDVPAHDASSHDADGWRTFSVVWKIPKPEDGPQAPLEERLHAGNPVKQTFGNLKKKHFARKASQRAMAL
jgi:phage terminase large subunit